MSSEFVATSRYHSDLSSPGRYVWSHVRRHWIYIVTLLIGAFSNAALASIVFVFIGNAFNKMLEF